MTSRLIYLIAPYSHASEAVRRKRIRQAASIAIRLMRRNGGDHVYAPTVHGHYLEQHAGTMNPTFWLDHCLTILSRCDIAYVAMLSGWENSIGVRTEIEAAHNFGIAYLYLDPATCLTHEPGKLTADWRSPLSEKEDPALGRNL